jgi:proteasome assembly chaperone (PAC2) family protein
MDNLLDLWEKPTSEECYLLAGWRQWADAGSVSSALPQYLVEQTEAAKIGRIKSDSFYLFQIPGAHAFLRPEIKLEDGYRRSLQVKKNELFFTGSPKKGLFIFMGEEPHLNMERYAETFFDAVEALGVKRVVALGGVYGAVPFNKDRQISSVYSLPRMKRELEEYAVGFSNYEGGVSIGSYLADMAEQRGVEYCTLYAFVPAYDFSSLSPDLQGIMIEHDYRAWYELLRRLNHMFGMQLDLTDLARRSDELTLAVEAKLSMLERRMPQVNLKQFMAELAADFSETPFMPLDDVWERELGDLFADEEEN